VSAATIVQNGASTSQPHRRRRCSRRGTSPFRSAQAQKPTTCVLLRPTSTSCGCGWERERPLYLHRSLPLARTKVTCTLLDRRSLYLLRRAGRRFRPIPRTSRRQPRPSCRAPRAICPEQSLCCSPASLRVDLVLPFRCPLQEFRPLGKSSLCHFPLHPNYALLCEKNRNFRLRLVRKLSN
jgi:hypothetical protein